MDGKTEAKMIHQFNHLKKTRPPPVFNSWRKSCRTSLIQMEGFGKREANETEERRLLRFLKFWQGCE